MTTELEKQFFDTFGIEQKTNQVYGVQLDYHIDEYPEITDRHYLFMLAYLICFEDRQYGTNEAYLKKKILEDMIQEQRLDKLSFEQRWESFDGFKTKDFVQALFKEE